MWDAQQGFIAFAIVAAVFLALCLYAAAYARRHPRDDSSEKIWRP
jgi:hypothetical protein